MDKDRIGVLFGGKSQEHEISILSAASLMDAIDTGKHEVVPVAIDKDGAWHLIESDMGGLRTLDDPRMAGLVSGAPKVGIPDVAGMVDFVFPMFHGPFGEDGTMQGLLEILGLPYAGCGVCSSAVSMDKIFTKKLLTDAGIPVLDYAYTSAGIYRADAAAELTRIEEAVGYPCYVKPANMGSSVGVSRASCRAELEAAIGEALRYDRRVLAEKEAGMRELETAVLGNDDPSAGAVGEIVTGGAFYDYETKYKVKAFDLNIPADIPKSVEQRVRELAIRTFKALDGAGFARVDFFAGDTADKVYVNEMNTIPGFTQYSMFPRLWEAAGVAYPELIERIIELGYERHGG
ncbi:MAG: D-alanine--D-alanine ligase [Clostridiales Family XIII bacterium]|jgi:D-alanine-D-alanine ligase|nr:D-alanine--D-alanine ligase [Clostridiales Family XIII bacterium]